MTRQRGGALLAKRAVDVVLAGLALVVAAPIIAIAALAILATMGRPVFFIQARPGRYGVPFSMIKLRTMRHDAGAIGDPSRDAVRLTTIGRLLRASSLDELPEFWNVLTGKMSLVGPRPLLLKYLSRYNAEQLRRHDVLPGLTGWAQVNGRNSMSWADRLAHDVWYVDHWSLALDARILFMTVGAVLRRSGIASEGHVSMPEFFGTELTADAAQQRSQKHGAIVERKP